MALDHLTTIIVIIKFNQEMSMDAKDKWVKFWQGTGY